MKTIEAMSVESVISVGFKCIDCNEINCVKVSEHDESDQEENDNPDHIYYDVVCNLCDAPNRVELTLELMNNM